MGKSRVLGAEAKAISRKLDGEEKAGKHIKVAVRHEGVVVLDFGYRHDRRAPNGHLPGQLHLSETDTIRMARCQISKEEYFQILKDKGLI